MPVGGNPQKIYINARIIMNDLILECNNFFKDCGFTYAFCGGYALELFLNKKIRTHSDIDITIFQDERKNMVEFVINKGWNIYSRNEMELNKIISSEDKKLFDGSTLWAIKPNCSFIKLREVSSNVFTYKTLVEEQLHFDFIDIFFNNKNGTSFICNEEKNITRKLDLSIMYNNSIPYLSPEIKLFFDSKPRYMELPYFKNKNRTDFEATAPFLSDEKRNWLINALEITYPDGHEWIGKLKIQTPHYEHLAQ